MHGELDGRYPAHRPKQPEHGGRESVGKQHASERVWWAAVAKSDPARYTRRPALDTRHRGRIETDVQHIHQVQHHALLLTGARDTRLGRGDAGCGNRQSRLRLRSKISHRGDHFEASHALLRQAAAHGTQTAASPNPLRVHLAGQPRETGTQVMRRHAQRVTVPAASFPQRGYGQREQVAAVRVAADAPAGVHLASHAPIRAGHHAGIVVKLVHRVIFSAAPG